MQESVSYEVHMQTAERRGYEGVPPDIVDHAMKNKHGILWSLELLYHILNKRSVTIVMPDQYMEQYVTS